MFRLKNLFFSLWMLVYSIHASTQPSSFEEDLSEHAYKINEYNTEITYYVETGTNKAKASIIETYQFEKINSSDVFTMMSFYDETQETFDSYECKKTSGWKLKADIASGTYSQGGVFHSDIKFKGFKINLKEKGDKGILIIRKTVNDIRYLSYHYFHTNYPVEKSTLKVNIPKDFDIQMLHINFDQWKVKSNHLDQENLSDKSYIFQVENLESDGFHLEDYDVLTIEHYPMVFFVPKSIVKNGTKQLIFDSKESYYSWAYQFINMLNPDKEILDKLYREIIPEGMPKHDQVKLIYNWVQDNIRYIAFEHGINGFKPDEAHLVYQKKYGDCKGKANLCIELLKRAGFKTHFVWVNTEYFPFNYDQAPILIKDNHVICAYEDEGELKYLDPTFSSTNYNEVPFYLFNKEVLVENGTSFIVDTIFKPNLQKEGMERIVVFDSIQKNVLHGKFKLKFYGGVKGYIFSRLRNTDKTDYNKVYKEILEADNKIKILNYNTSEVFNKENPFIIEGELIFKNSIQQFGKDRKFIAQFPYDDLRMFKWVNDVEVPIIFPWPISISDDIRIRLEDGFLLQSDNTMVSFETPNMKYSNQIKTNEGYVQVNRKIHIDDCYVLSGTLDEFNANTRKIIENSEKYLILKK